MVPTIWCSVPMMPEPMPAATAGVRKRVAVPTGIPSGLFLYMLQRFDIKNETVRQTRISAVFLSMLIVWCKIRSQSASLTAPSSEGALDLAVSKQ